MVTWGILISAQDTKPKIRVNVINVCTPSPAEQREIASALDRIPRRPAFASDFEIDRGRSTLEDTGGLLQAGEGAKMSAGKETDTWVRIRRDFAGHDFFSGVQYSFSLDPKNMLETLVFRVRDPRELLQVSIEDSASRVTSPAAMLGTETPATHIKLERFGKPSVALARCTGEEGGPAPDQSAYEPLFQSATDILADYHRLLDAQGIVPEELRRTEAGINEQPAHPVKGTPPMRIRK
jgi:hypothetical protein